MVGPATCRHNRWHSPWPGASATAHRSLMFLEALGGVLVAEGEWQLLLKHEEQIRQEPLKVSHFSV